MNLKLPQSIDDLSNIMGENNLAYSWSGAVVMPIIEDHFVFIRRAETMPTHKGQIGFMGGHKKNHEICPTETAKREFSEESGFEHSVLNVLGILDPVITSRRKVIIPVPAVVNLSKKEFLKRVKSNGEWDNLVLTPVASLKEQDLWVRASYVVDKDYPVYFASLSLQESHYLKESSEPYVLWGASAKMVLNFLQFL